MPGRITLNERETKLKDLLVDVAQRIDKTDATEGASKGEPLVLRWAGGWVRDKLLGVESHDIDTAINTMTGEAFAMRLRDICVAPEVLKAHAIGPDDIGSLHKIAKNPERSKHLETTTTRLFGLDVDFVNLRKETYADDSRNPQMEFGTAEEDALRRDATVNALFYNLQTGDVEDFTGGLADMEARLIRTPLEPFQTFKDDPLRVLRLVRFASRLEFEIDPAAQKVMGDERILEALRLKISRERVGIEIEKMLKGKHPRHSLQLLDQFGLYHAIFTDPVRKDVLKPDITNWKAAYDCLDALAIHKTPASLHDVLVRSDEAVYFSWMLAAVVPWEQLPDDPPPKPGKQSTPLATAAAREGFKATNRLSDVITAAHRHRPVIVELKDIVCQKDSRMNERDRFGMAIRTWDTKGGHWKLQVLYAILCDVMERTKNLGPAKDGSPASHENGKASDDAANAGGSEALVLQSAHRETVLREWQTFVDHLQELDVMDAPSIKRLLDGRQLATALGVKPGPWMTPAMDVVMAWQLRNPDETDSTGAIEEVRKRKKELGIP